VLTVASDETASTLTVTATSTVDNTKKGTATVTVKEPIPDGNETVEGNEMMVYGGNGFLIIKSPVEMTGTDITVYHISGQVIARQMGVNTPEVRINLPKGICIVRISYEGRITTKKVIIR
jgi:hypothetical protein